MKVICIKDSKQFVSGKLFIIKNKIYDVLDQRKSQLHTYCLVQTELNITNEFSEECLIPLESWREEQLNKLI